FITNKWNKITYNDISNKFNSNIIENIAKPLNLPSQNTAKFNSNLDNESDFISDAQINKIIQDFYALNGSNDSQFDGFSFADIQNSSSNLQIYG
ncbi:hypothetical protein, partial [Campylobacter portucalensis]|uniref:hypothetical protein n=1 Tax=Campylobacter portucalensis TaxID=2608384 RepID=UPI0018A6B1E3